MSRWGILEEESAPRPAWIALMAGLHRNRVCSDAMCMIGESMLSPAGVRRRVSLRGRRERFYLDMRYPICATLSTSAAEVHKNFVVGLFTDARLVDVSASPFEVAAHRNHAVRCAEKRFDKVAACLGVNCVFGAFGCGKLEFHACFESCKYSRLHQLRIVEGSRTCSLREVSTPNTACAARGMALRRLPPSISQSDTTCPGSARRGACEQLVELARPWWMSAARVAA